VTSLSRRFWPQTDNSTLQTQYWEPMGPAGVGVMVYAMGSSSSSSRQSVGHENREEPQCKWKDRKTLCWQQWVGQGQRGHIQSLRLHVTQNKLRGFPGPRASALPRHHPHMATTLGRRPGWEPSKAPTTCLGFAPQTTDFQGIVFYSPPTPTPRESGVPSLFFQYIGIFLWGGTTHPHHFSAQNLGIAWLVPNHGPKPQGPNLSPASHRVAGKGVSP